MLPERPRPGPPHIVHHSRALADLTQLDAVDADLEGHLRPNDQFVEEVAQVRARFRWTLQQAASSVLADRARAAGCRYDVDLDGMVDAVERMLPGACER